MMTTTFADARSHGHPASLIARRELLASSVSLFGAVALNGLVPNEAAAADATEGVVTVSDAQLFYRIEGIDEPLLMIAGFSCDLTIWDVLAPLLRERFRVVRFDNRGIGRSVTAPALGVGGMAEDAASLLAALGIERAHVLGHSMGGQIAQELCLRTPGRVATLGLLSSWAKPDARFAWLIRLFGDLADRLGPPEYPRVLLPWMFTDSTFNAAPQAMEAAVQEWADNPLRPTPALLRAQSQAILATDTSSRLNAIRVPTFVSVAAGDALTPPRLSRDLAAGIAGATYAVSGIGAHAFILDAAPQIAERLIAFLADHPIAT